MKASRSSSWRNKTVRSPDSIALVLSVASTAGEMVVHSVAVAASSNRLVDRLTFRKQKSVSIELVSPTNLRKQCVPRKQAAGPKAKKKVTVSVPRKTKKAQKVTLTFLSDDKDEYSSFSASTED